MYLADCHVHSNVSADAEVPMTELARLALEAGLNEVCFTDHVEPEVVFGARPDWKHLTAEFEKAQNIMGDQICLHIGVELGDAPWDFDAAEALLTEGPELDFVIGSVHCVTPKLGGMNIYNYVPKDEQEAYLAIEDYLSQLEKLAAWGKFDVLGHLTLPLRYINEHHHRTLTFEKHMHQVEDIFRIIIPKGIGIECNTNRGNATLPSAEILKLYHDMGGEVITLGSDAHDPSFVGCRIKETQELLRSCGLRYFTTFDKHKPEFHPL